MDQYEILRELGRGGTSVVYLVTDRADGRNYAMKTLREDCGNKPEEYEQKAEHLRAEAEVLKALCANGLESEVLKEICRDEQDTAFSHSGIPAFRECVCDENGDFAGFVMEYVEGRSLQQILEDGCGEKAQKKRGDGHHAARDGWVCSTGAVRRLGTVRRED